MKKPIKTRLISGITAFSLILTSMFVPLTSYGENEVPDTVISTEASASVGEDGTEGIPGVSGVSGEESTAAGVTGSTAEAVGDGSGGSTFVEGTTEASTNANDGVEDDTELSTEDTQETGTEVEKDSEEGTTAETGTEETTGADLFEGARKALEETETVDYRNLSFKLYPDEDDKDKTVTLTGFMPKDAEASAEEVTDEHVDDAELIDAAEEKEAGAKTGAKVKASAGAKVKASAGAKDPVIDAETESVVIAAYDITIMDGDEAYQPGEEHPVSVKIIDSRISASADISIWHIHDDGTREEIKDFTLGEGKVTFDATGFSVYEIAKKKLNGVGWQNIHSVSELIAYGSDGIVIGNSEGYYFTDGIYNPSGSRTGIKKTDKGKQPSDGARYYFELVEGKEDQFYVYCIKNGEKYYIYNVYTGNDNDDSSKSLNLTNDSLKKTAFEIKRPKTDTFTVKVFNSNFYWNQQGSASGKGFCVWNDGNQANSMIQFWHYVEVLDDPFELDGKSYGLMNYVSGSDGNALMAEGATNSLSMLEVPVRSDNKYRTLYVTEDASISMWTFHNAGEDYYYLSSSVGGNIKYIKMENSGLSLVDSAESATRMQVVPADNNTIKLIANGRALCFSEGNGFSVGTIANAATLAFVEVSDVDQKEKVTYSAKKIGI